MIDLHGMEDIRLPGTESGSGYGGLNSIHGMWILEGGMRKQIVPTLNRSLCVSALLGKISGSPTDAV